MPDDGGDGTRVPNAEHRKPEHGSVLARNLNLGPGQQYNHNQAGTGNTQYNAHTQILHVTAAPFTPEQKIKACQDALLTIRPEDHRAALISMKGDRVKGTCLDQGRRRVSIAATWTHTTTLDSRWPRQGQDHIVHLPHGTSRENTKCGILLLPSRWR